MKYIYVFYLVIPLYVMLLALLSAGESIPEDGEKKPSTIEKLFLRTASYIYRRFLKNNRFFLRSPGRRHVKDNLIKLDSEGDLSKKLSAYYIKKLSTMLVLIFMGSLLALLSSYQAGKKASLSDSGQILRSDYGKGEKETRLVATDENGESIGDFSLKISELEYTKEEAEKLCLRMAELFVHAV